ncbi:MAG: carbon-nitrogen hydrolase family protein [bacterium]|nr:carbon-nitrogen hydrolase family protein [bacterium]
MSFRIALVQPLSHKPPDDERNVADAVKYVEEAAAQGAEFVAFPESYPGPWRMPATFDPHETMIEAAKRCGIYVQYGTIEPINDAERTAYNLLMLARPTGGTPSKYRRTHPPGPWIYTGGPAWDFMYVAGDEYPVFETSHAQVGLAMCSEVYMPEVARALSLRGAELIFLPGGTDKQKLWATWRNLIWARAIENLAVVVTTQNLFTPEDRGLAMVATPEEVVFESTKAGMFIVDIDLGRIRQLREETDQPNSSTKNATKAGLLSQWQRPELYDKFFPKGKKVS